MSLPDIRTHQGARIVTIANQKGGSGKTTTAINLGQWFALQGYRVLLVDCDPSATLSRTFLRDDLNLRPRTLTDLISRGLGLDADDHAPADLLDEGLPPLPTAEAIVPLTAELHLLPANERLAAMELNIAQRAGQSVLRDVLAPVHGQYDLIILDTVPSLLTLQIMALRAAHELLIPLAPVHFDVWGLRELTTSIRRVKRDNPRLLLRGIILNRVQARTSLAQDIMARLADTGLALLGSVRQATAIAQAPGLQQTIFEFAPHSAAAEDYRVIGYNLLAAWADSATPIVPEVQHAR